jgi:hypothetical protein
MGSYKCSSCNSLILNGTIHGCYDVSNRVQPNPANVAPNSPNAANDPFNYPPNGSGATLAAQQANSTYGPGPCGSVMDANEVEPTVAGGPAGVALGRYPQPAPSALTGPNGSNAGSLTYEPCPAQVTSEAAAVTYNGKPLNVPVAYQTESGFVAGQAAGGMF